MRMVPKLVGALLIAAPALAQTGPATAPLVFPGTQATGVVATSDPAGSLGRRLRDVEDRLAIYELIASVPPSADTASGFALDRIYTEDGSFDRGEGLQGATGRESVKALIQNQQHQAAINGGIAHFVGLPSIDLRGDEAYVTSYLQLIQPDQEGRPRELANHGMSTGFRIHRVLANRWTLVRTADGWRIRNRTAIALDGSQQAVRLVTQGLEKYRPR